VKDLKASLDNINIIKFSNVQGIKALSLNKSIVVWYYEGHVRFFEPDTT